MNHRISVGALVLRNERLLLVHHFVPGEHDYWVPPGGGVEDDEELEAAVARETFEETRIVVRAKRLAYIDELIDSSGRMVKFWFVAEYLSGEIDTGANPAGEECISSAGWFAQNALPSGHVFPAILRAEFWEHQKEGFDHVRRLPLRTSVF
ncbi:MAG: NUDIX domain-containing protein [Paracoccaceae bacterium]|nr:NUDIX domain-containing protein [Paracoccaceae bacterium]